MKKKFVFIILILVSFTCGYFTSTLLSHQRQEINCFGTYSHEFTTISINHDFTYQYTYPFTSGQILKINETTYKLETGSLNEFIAIFSTNKLELINTKNNTITEFNKVTSSESQLKE